MVKQTYLNREIIIVDDGSTDGTFNNARVAVDGKSGVRIIRANHGGPSYARNLGVKESTGEIVFFGECDCVYDSDYVEKAVQALSRNQKAGAVCLTGAPLKLKSTLATDCIELENVLQHKLLESGKIKPFYAWVYWRDVFNKVGGYDEKLFQAEDRDLFGRVVKAGYEIAWIPGIHWRHKRVETLAELAGKWFRRGRTRVLFSLKNRLFLDLCKSLAPFWALVVGILVLFISPVFGVAIILLVFVLFLAQSARVERMVGPMSNQSVFFSNIFRSWLQEILVPAIGYTFGVFKILIRKAQGKEVSYKNL